MNMIPTTTGAATAVGKVIPELKGRLDGISIRVPTPDVSITDLTAAVKRPATAESVNDAMRAAANGPLRGVLDYCDEPLVTADFVGNPASCIFDSGLTKVTGDLVKVVGWYDNEWGYSNRLVDLVSLVGSSL